MEQINRDKLVAWLSKKTSDTAKKVAEDEIAESARRFPKETHLSAGCDPNRILRNAHLYLALTQENADHEVVFKNIKQYYELRRRERKIQISASIDVEILKKTVEESREFRKQVTENKLE